MLQVLHIGPITVQTSGIIYILGIWIGLSLAEKHSNKRGIEANTLSSIVFLSLVSGILAARFIYIAHYLSYFFSDPISIIRPNLDMLDMPGGIARGIIAALIYIYRKRLSLYQTIDALVPLLAIMSIGASLSNSLPGKPMGHPQTYHGQLNCGGQCDIPHKHMR